MTTPENRELSASATSAWDLRELAADFNEGDLDLDLGPAFPHPQGVRAFYNETQMFCDVRGKEAAKSFQGIYEELFSLAEDRAEGVLTPQDESEREARIISNMQDANAIADPLNVMGDRLEFLGLDAGVCYYELLPLTIEFP